MVYDEESILMMEGLTEDASVPDNEQDIKPRHHKARTVTTAHDPNVPDSQTKPEPDQDESDYEEDDEDFDTEWSLRKCSAATLDVLAVTFGDDLLAAFLPLVQANLGSPSWESREAGILALGAVAEGIFFIASHY